jgi:hypothetical protein
LPQFHDDSRDAVHYSLLALCLLIVLSGCPSRSTEEKRPPRASQPQDLILSLNQKIEAVRNLDSNEFRHTSSPITIEQAQELSLAGDVLKVLEIDHSELSNEKLTSLLKGMPAVIQLKLSGDVNNEQLAIIIENMVGLTTLNLPNGSFNDDGLKQLSKHETLEFLRFHSPHVTDTSMTTIAAIPQLRFLHLINVPISDKGLEPLYDLKDLESFYLDGSDCTEEGLSELIERRPDLHFHWNQLHLNDDPHSHPH